MKRDRLHAGRFNKPGELPLPDIVQGEGLAEVTGKNKPMVLVGRSEKQLLSGLRGLLLPQNLDGLLI